MYGKLFSRMYQGSMVGSGAHVFAVWGYCIACADPEEHTVDLNPKLLSTIIGETEERVIAAIDFLCAPDQKSHCEEHAGARLLHRGGLEYFLVTHESYRNMQNNEELREYFREAKRRQRAKEDTESKTVKDNLGHSRDSASASASASASLPEGEYGGDFLVFWEAYPRKIGKKAAQRAWKRSKDKPDISIIIEAIERQKTSDQWLKDCGRFIPHPATWLHQGRWDDETTERMVLRGI